MKNVKKEAFELQNTMVISELESNQGALKQILILYIDKNTVDLKTVK